MVEKLWRLKAYKSTYLQAENRDMASAIHTGCFVPHTSLDNFLNTVLKQIRNTDAGKKALEKYESIQKS